MVKTIRTWESVIFRSSSKDGKKSVSVDLVLNHEQKTYEFSTDGEDAMIRFRGTDKDELDLTLDAIKVAVNYVKENLK